MPVQPRGLEVGVERETSFSLADGQWASADDGTRVWMLEIASPGAVMLRLHLKNVDLPEGVKLEVSGSASDGEVSSFESRGPFADGEFWTLPSDGDVVRLALISEPGSSLTGDPFTISGVGHIYEDVRAGSLSLSPCELDAACYPDWSGTGDSVVRLVFSSGPYLIYCSGTLINNLTGDFSPFILTAAHCVNSEPIARSVVAYFFFVNSTCHGFVAPTNFTSGYGVLLATTPTEDTDASLLQLLNPLPAAAVWAAWTSVEPPVGSPVTAIHHPAGSSRYISFGARSTDTVASVYSVNWSQGTTDPGSSGGALFNANHEVVGQLYGGVASCTTPGPDTFPKLSASYPKLTGVDGRVYLRDGLPDDNLANNSRERAYAVTLPASLNNLVVKKAAEDWFKVSVAANQGFAADLPYLAGNTNVRLQVYRGSDTVPIYTGSTHVEAGAGNSPIDFFIRAYLPDDPYYTAVHNDYSLSFTSKQVPFAGAPVVTTGVPSTTFSKAYLSGSYALVPYAQLNAWSEWGTDPTLATHSTDSTGVLTGLTPSTQYYVRYAVDWPGGPVYGAVVPFQTKALGSFAYYPAPDTANVWVNLSYLSWQGYGDSYDVYLGTSSDPPFLSTVTALNQSEQRAEFPTWPYLHPSSTYHWRIVAKYQGMAESSPVLMFSTQNVLQVSGNTNFGAVPMWREGAETYLRVSASEPVTITSVSVTGDFVQHNDCVGTLLLAATCKIYVTFSPTALGQRTGSLVITNNKYPLERVDSLSGIGTEIVLDLNRPSRPARGSASMAIPLAVRTSAGAECKVSPSVATCRLVERNASTVVVLTPRVRGKRRGRRRDDALPAGRYRLSLRWPASGSDWEIPIEIRSGGPR